MFISASKPFLSPFACASSTERWPFATLVSPGFQLLRAESRTGFARTQNKGGNRHRINRSRRVQKKVLQNPSNFLTLRPKINVEGTLDLLSGTRKGAISSGPRLGHPRQIWRLRTASKAWASGGPWPQASGEREPGAPRRPQLEAKGTFIEDGRQLQLKAEEASLEGARRLQLKARKTSIEGTRSSFN